MIKTKNLFYIFYLKKSNYKSYLSSVYFLFLRLYLCVVVPVVVVPDAGCVSAVLGGLPRFFVWAGGCSDSVAWEEPEATTP